MMVLAVVVEHHGGHVVTAAVRQLVGGVGVAVRLFVGCQGDGRFIGMWDAATEGQGRESKEMGR